jgi:hypothetical protein
VGSLLQLNEEHEGQGERQYHKCSAWLKRHIVATWEEARYKEPWEGEDEGPPQGNAFGNITKRLPCGVWEHVGNVMKIRGGIPKSWEQLLVERT